MTLAAQSTDDDAALLHEYAERRSEAAFAELVRRHVNLVHSAALRQVGSDVAAQDVTQGVFTELARQAGRLTRHPALTGWLYTTTRRLAAHAVRSEIRRQRREQEAHMMQELLREPASVAEPKLDWERVRPVLDAAMHDLGEPDRIAVLLRHFEQRPLTEVGVRLGLSTNAARMRVDRALDKLRAKLAKRGVTSTSAALAAALAGPALTAAPATLAATITTTVLAATVSATSTFGFLSIMASTKLKVAAAVLLVASAGTALVLQLQSNDRLRAANDEMRQRAVQLSEETRAAQQAESANAAELARLRQSQVELLGLRGEVAQLRKQLAAARTVPTPKPGPQPEVTQETDGDASRAFGIRRLSEAKLLVLGFHLFAGDHEDRFPTSLEIAAAHLTSSSEAAGHAETLKTLQTGDYELLFQGSLKEIGNPAEAIVVREREAWPGPNGGWMRTYGFADSHSEIHRSDDGDFTAWEAQRQVRPPSGTSPGAAPQK